MRATALFLATALLLATASASWADCSMHTASSGQNTASGNQTPIPPKAKQGNQG